ncbi:hypothetical protein J2T57_004005 [Natronocella acetinitrilica]|uniref:Uncharacterized protein n=1 Tax=Natronocella acetinitrilica TaxID=414046 RepID=A0AAE3G7H3_9GAMM|nr:hypothetical protein [Natronocella acetinitrilica]MCP1676832.1 hypothetical protein [Natronocella acetinitrilica]
MLFLEQSGDGRVEGTYPVLEGEISGQVDGRTLRGTWSDPGGTGEFVFSLSPDGETFMGRFGTGEWWTARRKDADEIRQVETIPAASTPGDTLFAFLRAGNDARDGRTDRFGPVLPLLDYDRYPEDLPPAARIGLAMELFNVLDRTTVRVRRLVPSDPETTEYVATLSQAGTRAQIDLSFVREEAPDGSDRWLLVVPSQEEMDRALVSMLRLFDGEMPHAREHHLLKSPRDTMRTFQEQWELWRTDPTDLFVKTMDMSQIPSAIRSDEAALRGEYLKEVMDRIGLVLPQEIPDNPKQQSPYLHFQHPAGSVEIVPVLVDVSEDGENETWIWQFSAETVDSARDLFIALEDMPRDELAITEASSPFFELRSQIRAVNRDLLNEVGGVEVWQWLTLTAWLLVSIPVSWLLSWLTVRMLRLGRNDGRHDDNTNVVVRFSLPLLLVLVAWSGLLLVGWLGLPQNVDIPLRIALGVVLSIAGGWLA